MQFDTNHRLAGDREGELFHVTVVNRFTILNTNLLNYKTTNALPNQKQDHHLQNKNCMSLNKEMQPLAKNKKSNNQ